MRSPARPTRLRTALLTALGLTLVTAGPATAHDELVGTTPASSARVGTAPQQVVLRFSEAPGPVGTRVSVKDSSGRDWAAGTPTRSGSTVTAPLRSGAGAGAYKVAWRVVSDDGHPVSGTFDFTVSGGKSSPATSSVTTPATSAGTDAAASRPDADQVSRGSKLLTGILVAFLVIVLAGIGALLMRRERR